MKCRHCDMVSNPKRFSEHEDNCLFNIKNKACDTCVHCEPTWGYRDEFDFKCNIGKDFVTYSDFGDCNFWQNVRIIKDRNNKLNKLGI